MLGDRTSVQRVELRADRVTHRPAQRRQEERFRAHGVRMQGEPVAAHHISEACGGTTPREAGVALLAGRFWEELET